jgi:hypothetical protein
MEERLTGKLLPSLEGSKNRLSKEWAFQLIPPDILELTHLSWTFNGFSCFYGTLGSTKTANCGSPEFKE